MIERTPAEIHRSKRRGPERSPPLRAFDTSWLAPLRWYYYTFGVRLLTLPPVPTFTLRAGAKPGRADSDETASLARIKRERAVSALRTQLIDRLDDAFVSGEIAEMLGVLDPCLREAGYDRLDVLRAIQNTLFPEAFFPPEGESEIPVGLVPKNGCGATLMQLTALAESMREHTERTRKSFRACAQKPSTN